MALAANNPAPAVPVIAPVPLAPVTVPAPLAPVIAPVPISTQYVMLWINMVTVVMTFRPQIYWNTIPKCSAPWKSLTATMWTGLALVVELIISFPCH